MVRYFVIFAIVLSVGLVMMAGILAQNGFSLFAPEMRMMLLACVLAAAYVSWRISTLLKRRKEDAAELQSRRQMPITKSGLAGLIGGKSTALLAREARLAARKRQLVAEGKLAPGEVTEVPAPLSEETGAPTRAAASASVKEKMAARAERVRRAREEGKI